MPLFGSARADGPVLPTHNGSDAGHSAHRRTNSNQQTRYIGGRDTGKKTRGYNAQNPPSPFVRHVVAMVAEFVGTTLFLWFALSATQIANNIYSDGRADAAPLFYISLAFGFSLMINAWAFYRISGGLFNPAVTLGLCIVGGIPWVRGVLFIIAQIIAGIVAAALVTCMFPGPHTFQTTLQHGASTAQGLFIEMFLTALLVITILMLAVEKSKAAPIAPIGIGLALFVAELSGVYYTGGSLNPARSFGPAVALRSFERHHWIYWLGPVMGAVLAAGFYGFAKYFNYEDVNPGQDAVSSREKERAERNSRPSSQRSTRSH